MEKTAAFPERRRRRRVAIYAAVGALAIFGGVAGTAYGLASSAPTPPPKPEVATGVVACKDNLPVEGVWISAGPSSGWANTLQGPSPSEEIYSRIIHVGSYTVHVGCGGSPETWQTSDYATSNVVVNFPAGFQCGPTLEKSAPTDRGICEQVGVTALKTAA